MTLRDPQSRRRTERPTPRHSPSDRRAGMRLSASGLRPLREIEHDYEVADGYEDIRGWIVTAKNGAVVGSVADLIVDTEAMLARYVLVTLGPQGTDEEIGRRVLIPITEVTLHGATDEARVPAYTAVEITDLPSYSRAMLDRDYDAGLLRRIGVRALVADAERPVEGMRTTAEHAAGTASRAAAPSTPTPEAGGEPHDATPDAGAPPER